MSSTVRAYVATARIRRSVLLATTLIAAMSMALPVAAASAAWPATWTPYAFADGTPIMDVGGDENPGYSDIWSGAASGLGSLPTAYVSSDGTNVFFRMRAAADPEVNKGGSFNSTVWLVQIAVGGETKAIVGLDGKPAGVNDIVYASNAADTMSATAYEPVAPNGAESAGGRVVNDGAGGYFVDFQLPISVITGVAPEVTPNAPVQLFFGTSTSNTNINKDFMIGSSVSYAGLATLALDGSPVADTSTEVAITSPASTSTSFPTISGTGESGAAIDVTVAGQTLTTTVASGGTWSVTVPVAIADGSYPVSVLATDTSGNTATATQTLVVDAPPAVSVTTPPLTSDSTPVISGTGEPGAAIVVDVAGQTMTTTVASDGTWSVTVPVALNDGQQTVTVTATDTTGNTATVSQPLTVDTVTAVSITSSASTDDPTPSIAGTGEPGSTISLVVDGQTLTSAVDATGSWSITVPVALVDKDHTVVVTATDLAGNTATAAQVLTVDTATWVAITTPTNTNDSTPIIAGVGEPGATVVVTVGGQSMTTTVAPGGTWSVTVPAALSEGSSAVTVTATDAAGFTATATQALTVDTTTAVTLTPPGTTDNPTPTISGTGEAGATITLEVDEQTVTGTVDALGSWSISVPSALADGAYTVAVTATDLAGNTDTDEHPLVVDTRTTVAVTSATLTRDSTPTITGTGEPGAEVTIEVGTQVQTTTVGVLGTWTVTSSLTLVDGRYPIGVTAVDALGNAAATTSSLTVDTATSVTITSPTLTSDNTPIIAGSGEPGATISLVVGGQTLEGVVDGAGFWSITVPATLADTDHDVTATATDRAGNTATADQVLTVDATTFVTITSPPLSGTSTPTIAGLAEPNAVIEVTVGSETLTTTVGTDGAWTVMATIALDDGTYVVPVTATVADVVGNSATTSQTLTVDTVTSVSITSAAATTDPTPSISGSGEPGSTIALVVGGQSLSAEVDGTGSWSIAVPVALADGMYPVSVTATDPVGNTATTTQELTVDSQTFVAVSSPPLTQDPTPVISGTGEPGSTISVSVDGQNLTDTVAGDGTWSVVASALADAAYPVSVTATDVLGNTATAVQNVTVDSGTTVAITSESSTDNRTPVISGSGEPGSTISLVVDGQTLSGVVDATGSWSIGVPVALADGMYPVSVTATDLAGNTAITTQELTVDTQTFVAITTSPLASSSTPTIGGNGEPGSTISVSVDGQNLTAIVAGDGTWSVVASALADANHPVTVTATDVLGNTATTVQNVTVDTGTTVAITSESSTDNRTPAISGSGEPGSSIALVVGGQTLSGVVDATGSWSIAVPVALADGVYPVSVTATDLAGNTAITTQDLTVDTWTFVTITTPPLTSTSTPTIGGAGEPGSTISVSVDGRNLVTTVADDGTWSIAVALADGGYAVSVLATDSVGNTKVTTQNLTVDTGTSVAITSSAFTNSATPTITGVGEPGAAIEVTVDGQTLTTTVTSGGTWSVVVPSALADGSHTVTVTATDLAGFTATTAQSLVVDATTSVTLVPPGATDNPTPTLTGTGEPGATIELTVDEQTLAGVVGGSGSWSIGVPVALDDGDYIVTVTATDLAGNVDSDSATLTVDTRTTIGITSPALTRETTPTITGTGEPGAAVTIEVGTQILTTTVGVSGTWAVTPTGLTDGAYVVSATAVDGLDNTAATTQRLTVDSATAVAISSPTLTSDTTPIITGTGEPGSSIELVVAGQTLSAVVDGMGSWSIAIPVALADATHPVSVTATDLAGNTATASQDLTIDATTFVKITSSALIANPLPRIEGEAEAGAAIVVEIGTETLNAIVGDDGTWSVTATIALDDGNYMVPVRATVVDVPGNTASTRQSITIDTTTTAAISSPAATTDPTPNISGSGEPGSSIALVVGGQPLSAVVDGTGSWSIAVPVALADGMYPVSVTATDLAGNIATTTKDLTVDTRTFAAISTSPSTTSSTPTIGGTGEPGSTISVSVDGQNLTDTVADDGTWSVISSALADATYPVSVRATDVLGNTATTVQTLTIDTGTTVAITSAATADNRTPVISGSGEPGSTIAVVIDGQTLSGVVDGTGSWSIAVPVALTDGTYPVSVTATDLAGNTATATHDLTVDTRTFVTLTSASSTSDSTPTLSGTGEPGSTISVSVDGQDLPATVADDGTWSVTVPSALGEGTYPVSVSATDVLGNTASTVQSLTVDTGTVVAITSAPSTDDEMPLIFGTGEAGATISVLVGGQTLSATVGPGGSWSVTVPVALPDGTYTMTVTATDAVGNTISTTQSLLVDTTTFVSITSAPLTNNSTPTIGGLGAADDSIVVTVAGQTMTTTVTDDGTWSVVVPAALADGSHVVSVTATDAVGNTATSTQDLIVDTTLSAVVTSPTIGNDTTPTISGTGEPGAIVTIEIDGRTVTTTVPADGTWSLEVVPALPDGTHIGQITVVDPAGNVRTFSHQIVIDTIAQLMAADPGLVSDSTPTISGTGEPGATVSATVAGRTYSTTVSETGTWSVVVVDALPDGEYPLVIRIEDALGNVDSATRTLIIDTVAELGASAPIVAANGDLVGAGEPGASITVTVAGVTTVTTVASDGTWSVPFPSSLASGTHLVTVVIRDLAGNTSEVTYSIAVNRPILAVTGGSPHGFLGVALLLALVGGFLLAVAYPLRRRRLVELD